MRLRVCARLFATAGLGLLVAASSPAFGQTADVAVTLTAGTAGSTASLGTAKTFKLTVKNNGPSHATSFTVDGTFTPPAAPYDTIQVGTCDANGENCVIAGCTPNTAGTNPPALPCTVTLAAPLVSGASATVSIPVTVLVPAAPLPTAAADCPSGDPTVGPFFVRGVVSVPQVFQGATSVDPNLGDNTSAPVDVAVTPWTDIAISDASATPNSSEGGTLQYSATVTNYGPCDATTAFSDFVYPSTILIDSSTVCANDVGADFGCDLGTVNAGAAATYTVTATVLTFPKSVIKAAIPVSIDITCDQDIINGPDPSSPDHSPAANVSTTIDLSKNDSGCSTGGAGTLFGLLSLVGLRFARRRKS